MGAKIDDMNRNLLTFLIILIIRASCKTRERQSHFESIFGME